MVVEMIRGSNPDRPQSIFILTHSVDLDQTPSEYEAEMQTRNFSYNLLRITKEIPCASISGQQTFIYIPLFAFKHTLLSLKYYAPDTRSSVNICNIILTLVSYSISYI